VMVGNITFLMIFFAVFDPSPLTLWINCSFSINYILKIGEYFAKLHART